MGPTGSGMAPSRSSVENSSLRKTIAAPTKVPESNGPTEAHRLRSAKVDKLQPAETMVAQVY